MSVKKLIEAMQDIEIVDLGQVFEENMPAHPSHSRFFRMPWHSPALGDIATDYQLVINEHNGTHVDSFRHYIAKDGYEWIDGIPLERFQAPFVVIDATYLGKCETLSLEAVKQWEAENGEIEKGCAVLVDTGRMIKCSPAAIPGFPAKRHSISWIRASAWWVSIPSASTASMRTAILPTWHC